MLPNDDIVKLRDRSQAAMGMGIGLLVVAGLLWAWFAFLFLTPFSVDVSKAHERDCEAPVSAPREQLHARESFCGEERDWPQMLGVLALSLPFATAGALTYGRGAATFRICLLLQLQSRTGE
ncbi:hypothetical protein SLA_6188 [Streptomyces laurentii]|uniref:Uncharacterized protein n=1 Tax=Streptomyces laurentii TaxID=39478 RepID=A0A160P5K6_STRLU|nr:hypothetical protein SLA_6188 [Streptomyces laurentii]